jgi:hypothetical protein
MRDATWEAQTAVAVTQTPHARPIIIYYPVDLCDIRTEGSEMGTCPLSTARSFVGVGGVRCCVP